MKTNTKRLLNDTLIFTIGNLGSKIIQFVLVPYYTYAMTVDAFGVAELLVTTVSVLMPILSLSVAEGLLRFGLESRENRGDILLNAGLTASGGVLLSAGLLPVFRRIAFIGNRAPMLVLLLAIRIYQELLSTYAKVSGRNRVFAANSILVTLVLCASNVIFLTWLNMGVDGYLWANILSGAVSMVYLFVRSHAAAELRRGKVSAGVLRTLLAFSLPMILNAISGWIINVSDRYMIQLMLDDFRLGLYTTAAKIPSLLTTFTSIFLQAWTISAIHEKTEANDSGFYTEVHVNYLAVLLLGTAALNTVMKPFMSIYVSQAYTASWQYVPLLLSGVVCMSLTYYYGGIYIAFRRTGQITATILTGAAVNILLNWLLIPRWGVFGAAAATWAAWFLVAVWRMIDMHRTGTVRISWGRMAFLLGLNLAHSLAVSFLPFGIGLVFSLVTMGILLCACRGLLQTVFRTVRTHFLKE